jgi:hypothetical protein
MKRLINRDEDQLLLENVDAFVPCPLCEVRAILPQRSVKVRRKYMYLGSIGVPRKPERKR